MDLISRSGEVVWHRDLAAAYGLTGIGFARFARDGRAILLVAGHHDGRRGVWSIPAAGRGTARLVVAFDDPALTATGYLSVSDDRVFLTVAEYESDIWVARLRW
jgi:hypothetical protein